VAFDLDRQVWAMQTWLASTRRYRGVSALGFRAFPAAGWSGVRRIEPGAGGSRTTPRGSVGEARGGKQRAVIEHAHEVVGFPMPRAAASLGWSVIGWRP